MTSFQNEGGMWTLASQLAIKEIASYMRCVSCAVCASDRNVRAEAELLGPVHESQFTLPEASKAFLRDSDYTEKIRGHPIQFKYDDDHTEYADCVVDVRDVQRVKLVVWWLQIVAVRSLYLLGTEKLSQVGLQHVLSMLLTEDTLTTTGKPLPTVLEELAFSTEWYEGYEKDSFDLPVQCQYLRKLQMQWYPLSTLEGIQKLTALEELRIMCTYIQRLDPLAACTHLQTLVLDECETIQSLDVLQNLSDLTDLTIQLMVMEHLMAFKSLIPLRRLDLSFCDELRSLEGVEHLTQLRELVLHCCLKLHSLEGLQNVTALTLLDVSYTMVSNLKPLKGCIRLEMLVLDRCEELHSLEGLEGLTSLTDLFLSFTKVDDLTPLAGCVRMKELYLEGFSGVRSVAALSCMTSLETLSLNNTFVSDLTPLAGCVQMKELYLKGCRGVQSVAPLVSLPALTYLNLIGTSVPDLSPLQHQIDEGKLRVERFEDLDMNDTESDDEDEEEAE